MSLASKTQVGMKDEVTPGTEVVVTKFQEFTQESVKSRYGRTDSAGMRSGQRAQRSDRFVPYLMGAAGGYQFEVLTKGFAFWLKHMLGSVATSGPTDTTAYTHTGTVGAMLGQAFTWQVNRPFHPADTDQAWTFAGGKVTKWKLSNKVDGMLVCDLDLDFMSGVTATALATASYPSSMQNLSWAGGLVTIGGSSYDITDIEIACDNQMKVGKDRQYLRNSTAPKEPVESKYRDITWKIAADNDALTQINRARATLASGAGAQIIASWTGPVLVGAATVYPSVTATIPFARFDGDDPTVGSSDPLTTPLSGVGLYDGSNSPVTIAVVTAETTP
jgi:hypothetical protein